jgi:hypothetical protein
MPINIPFQNDSNTSSYIVNLSNTSGKTYRELKSLWDKYNREVQYDVMYNPTKYINFGKTDLYTEIGRRLEDYLTNPNKEAKEELQNQEVGEAEQQFGNDIEQDLENPTADIAPEGTEPPTEGDMGMEEPSATPTEEVPPEGTEEGQPTSTEPTEETPESADEASQIPSEEEFSAMIDDLEL